jgi:hypothetical protein
MHIALPDGYGLDGYGLSIDCQALPDLLCDLDFS